jgi:hypothetical protein
LRGQVAQITAKLQRLLDSFLDELIDRQTYTHKKAQLMSEKKSLEEKMSDLALGQCGWVEPMRQWLDKASFYLFGRSKQRLYCQKELACGNLWVEPVFNKQKCRRKRRPISNLPPEKPLVCAPRNQRKKRRNAPLIPILFRFWRASWGLNPGHPA